MKPGPVDTATARAAEESVVFLERSVGKQLLDILGVDFLFQLVVAFKASREGMESAAKVESPDDLSHLFDRRLRPPRSSRG
jgi:hypothetical protein